MQFISKVSLVLTASLTLTACGGGGSGGAQMTPQSPNIPTSTDGVKGLSAAQIRAVADFAENASSGLSPTTDVSNVAPGTAIYYGALSLEIGDDPQASDAVIGALNLNVQFNDKTVTGEAGSFINALSNANVDGTLTLENGVVLEGPVEIITGDLRGNLNIAGRDTAFDLAASGIYQGENAEVNEALIFGEATVGDATQDVSGTWQVIAE